MLARLLRWMLFGQMVLGALLGYWLVKAGHGPWWMLMVCAAALPLVIMALVVIVSCSISREKHEPPAMWWRSLLGEFAAGLVVFVFRQPWAQSPPTLLDSTAPISRIPVVLVHGYLCNHRIWDDMATALRAQGHAVFAVNLEPLFTSIDRYVPIVNSAVLALLQHTGRQQVALIGHSMGGLAIRAWMRTHGTAQVASVITLGTPHAGTKLARGAHTPNGRQMRWKSQWLTELASSETPATHALMQIVITPQDNIVCPQRAQVLTGIDPLVFEGIGHLQMCIHPPIMQWVASQLAAVNGD
jgi:triacylglycerol esterase/lipase EstA (alpha/beta hydrolase family)